MKLMIKQAMSGMTINPELLAEVDRIRGPIPRSRFVAKALERYVDDIKNQRVSALGEAIIQKNEV